MNIFLIILVIWVSSGILSVLLKMFVLFRGPDHMINMYILHDATRVRMIELYKSAKKSIGKDATDKNIAVYIAVTQFIFGVVVAPLAIIDLFFDMYLFTFFDVEKAIKKQNERLNNGQ